MGRTRRIALYAVFLLLVAAAAISAGLWLTPMQSVSTAGQTIDVGATAPSLGLSGPGEVDLFGQQLPTVVDFAGPVRPRLRLSHITLSQQLSEVARSGADKAAKDLERALIGGWERYFAWEIVIVGAAALVLTGAAAGWLRRGRRTTVIMLAAALVTAEAINVGAIMVTAYTVPDKLRSVTSLQALVGTSPPTQTGPAPERHPGHVQRLVVIGDSTAAGLGNAPLPHPTAVDRSCRRSADAYALVLGRVNQWQVTNLACSGATIAAGLLGPQQIGDRTIPAQLDQPEIESADVIVVSIGANDVHWADLLRICAATRDCANKAERAYFQKELADFTRDYLRLIGALQVLPDRPSIVVNQYYDPLVGSTDCLAKYNITADKLQAVTEELNALNQILASGAQAAGFAHPRPSFDGHGLCSANPYVQGLDATAPFHPTAGGELAIALADEHALLQLS